MEGQHLTLLLTVLMNVHAALGAAILIGPAAVEHGQNAFFLCGPDILPDHPRPGWFDQSGSPTKRLFFGETSFVDGIPKYSNFEASLDGAVMTITGAAVEDEGSYFCAIGEFFSETIDFAVEVRSFLTMTLSTTDPLRAGTEFTATCDVIDSRPQLDIEWTINDISLGVTPVVTNPTNVNPYLSDTRSEVILTATPAMNGHDLKCTTSGHLVTSLNREETLQLNVQYAPTSETATIVVDATKEGDALSVTCQVSAVNNGMEPANPAINMYTFYVGSEQIQSFTTLLLVAIPEYATDYRCTAGNDLGTIESETVNFDPGLDSTLTMTFSTDPLLAGIEFTATCDVIGSRPQLDISWTFNDIPLGVTPVVTNPANADPDLSDTRSAVTLTATPTMNGQDLKCTTSGHVVTSLNREETTQLNVQYAPTIDTATIDIEFSEEGDALSVTCQVSAAVDGIDPANPAINSYTIYAGSEQIHSSTTDNSVLMDIPEYATDYRCIAGNDLGTIESEAVNYDPGLKQVSKGTPDDAMPCSGLSPGAMAGMVVLAILFTTSVCIDIVLFVLWRRERNTRGPPGNKREKIGERDTAQEGNDTQAYELIQSAGNAAAYTSLNLAKQSEVSPAAEDVSFFSRLGSIGRGDFGAMWTGALRSNQGQLPVAIRSVPDHVTKSTNIDQSSKILSKLPNHPHVVTCIGYCVGNASLLYELIPGGSLLTHLQTSGGQSAPTYSNLKPTRVNLEESNLLKLAWQVAKGMDFLASRKLIHGTLCAHNVLMTEDKQCKISDYGVASVYGFKIKPTRWSSPETMTNSACSVESDIWSYGIVLWEIVTLGARPYPKMTFDIVQREVTQGYKMSRPQHCGQELYAIMKACWEKDPQNRSSFQQILKKLERLMEKDHVYLELDKLDGGLYETAS